MTNNSEWQEANRELIAEERRRLGDPPTAEEMLAYSRGELSETEEDRIRDLLVAYPEIARMYGAAFPEPAQPGDPDYANDADTAAAWARFQERLGRPRTEPRRPQAEGQRGRVIALRHLPTAVAAVFAMVFFGLFLLAESRARFHAQQRMAPRILGSAQELDPDGRRGAPAPTLLRKDGEAYLLKPRLINEVRHAHYQMELHDAKGEVIWTNNTAQPDQDDAFQIVVPHAFLQPGETYHLRIYGADGDSRSEVASYDVVAPAE
jgi:hypothetical protein